MGLLWTASCWPKGLQLDMQDVHGNGQCWKAKETRLIQYLQLQIGLCDTSLPNITIAQVQGLCMAAHLVKHCQLCCRDLWLCI